MHNLTQHRRPDSVIESQQPAHADDHLPNVRIIVDEPAQFATDRGPRVMMAADIADERARMTIIEAPPPVVAELQTAHILAVAGPDTGAVLLEAAKEVHAARATLAHLDGRLLELQEKFGELKKLEANVISVRKRRVDLLTNAALAGGKADTAKIDKEAEAASIAFQRREDELVGTEHALATLEAQRKAAERDLMRQERAFNGARGEYVGTIARCRTLTLQFLESIIKARRSLAQMPAPFRERLLSAQVKLHSDQLPAIEALQELVTIQAEVAIAAADELAALPPPPVPRSLGFVWRDNTVHDEPEPVPASISTTSMFAADMFAPAPASSTQQSQENGG